MFGIRVIFPYRISCSCHKEGFQYQRLRRRLHIQHVLPKPFDVLRQIRTQASDDLRRDAHSLLLQRLEHIGHIHHIVEHHRIRDQVPILDPFFLLHGVPGAQHRPPKRNPVSKLMV